MEKTMLKINYRTLSGGEHSPWLQTSTLDEFVWGGAYELMFASDDGSHGLPFRFTQDEKVTLIVNDNNKGNTHGMHTIVQRLTYVEHATCDLVTYTRTRRYSNGKHQWGEWVVNAGKESTDIVEHTATQASILPNVLNIWGEVVELNITLAPPVNSSIVNEYMVQFVSGETATTLMLPSDIKWLSIPVMLPNKIYQLSIVNNLAVIGEFGNE